MKKILQIMFIVGIFSFVSNVYAKDYKGEGKAVIINGNQKEALKLALTSAIKKSVSAAMEELIKDSGDQKKYYLNKGELLKKEFDFIDNQNVIDQKQEGKFLSIKTNISINEAKLKSFLEKEGVLISKRKENKKNEFPAIMVVNIEELNGNINKIPYSSRIIRDTLRKKGFEIVDESVLRKSLMQDKAIQAVVAGDLKAAQSIALQNQAGILITGRSVVTASAMKSGGMQVYGANVNLEAVKSDSGSIIASGSGDSSYPHINSEIASKNALEAAAQKAVDQLIKGLESSLEEFNDSMIVSISGLNFEQLAIIKQILKRDFKEIDNLKQITFLGDIAKLQIKVKINASEFADNIALKDFGTFKLKVLNYSSSKLDLKLQTKN